MREILQAELARLNALKGTLQSRDDVLVTIGQVIAVKQMIAALDTLEQAR
jgi:hypothetical protein